MTNGFGIGVTVVPVPNRYRRQATRERIVDLFRVRVKLPPAQHLEYKAVTVGTLRLAWQQVPSPSFDSVNGGSRIHSNRFFDFRLYPNTSKITGPAFPSDLAGRVVVCDGIIERLSLPGGEIYLPISFFITERPLSAAQWELSYPLIRRESDRRDGDIVIPGTAHVIRRVTVREIEKALSVA